MILFCQICISAMLANGALNREMPVCTHTSDEQEAYERLIHRNNGGLPGSQYEYDFDDDDLDSF